MNEQKDILENSVFESYWLSHANPDTVFEWLREQKPYFDFLGGRADEIETVLIERNEPLMNLGLALYARVHSETALSLFRNGDATVKKALLSGPSVLSGVVGGDWIEGNRHDGEAGVLKELLESFDDNVELLYRLLSNKDLFSQILVNLYHKGTPFAVLTDEQWLKAIQCTVSNPQLSRPSGYLEKLEFLPPEHPCQAAWNLYNTVPVHAESARVLARLGEELAPHGDNRVPHAPSGMDVLNTIKRWEVEGDDKYDYFCKCRATLGRLLKDEELKDSDDIALRQAYYGGGWRNRKPEEVREAFEKDRGKFLDVAIENLSFYRNEHVRDELRRCCHDFAFKDEYHGGESWDFGWQHHLDIFDSQHDRLRKHEPKSFPDFDGEIPFEEINDLGLRAEERLMFLQNQIKVISRELVGKKSKDDDGSWPDEEETSLIEKMKAELDQSNELILSKLASVTGWAVFVGIVFAIILIVVLIKM